MGTKPDSESNKKFPIPNEKKMRMTEGQSSKSTGAPRTIKFRGSDPDIPDAKTLSVKPPGLMWKGKPSISSIQLQDQMDARLATLRKRMKEKATTKPST